MSAWLGFGTLCALGGFTFAHLWTWATWKLDQRARRPKFYE